MVIAFLDANALIYLLEAREPFAGKVRTVLRSLRQRHPGVRICVSRLTWLECRVGPMKSGDQALLQKYDAFFALPDLLWIELTKTVVELATQIRASHGLKTPDYLQAACCLQLGSDHVFLTGDIAFKRIPGLQVKRLA